MDRLTLILASVFAILAIVTGVVAFIWVRGIVSTWTMTTIDGAPVDTGNVSKTGTPMVNGTVVPVGALQKSSDPTSVPWDGASRITLLAMGLDYRDWESNDIPRTDSMMLLTMDPVTKTGGMLSIPRDMWVTIPGFDHGKINTAYFLGEGNKLPGGGPGLAMATVEQFIGVPINYYAVIDFNAFVAFINELNGLKMDIPQDITLDPLGPGNKFTLQAGRYVLDGQTVLAYARQRYTEGGDFDRAQRQQQVIMAMRDRILNFNTLPVIISRAPAIYKELSAGIRTNLTLDQILRLATTASQISEKNIRKGVLGTDTIQFGKSPDGLDILKPIPDKVRLVRDEVFATGGPAAPATVSSDQGVLMKTEAAKVALQNGTATANLATKTKDLLTQKGVIIVEQGNATQRVSATTIYDYSGRPYTVNYLVNELGIRSDRILNRFDPNSKVDVLVVLGDDWAAKQK